MSSLSTRTSFPDLIDQRAEQHPDKAFLWIDDDRYSYGDLRDRSRRTANGLVALGLQPAETVASFTRTCWDALGLMFGAVRAGGVYMSVNTAFKGEYLLHQLRDAHARIILVDEELLPRVEQILDRLPELRTILVRGATATSQMQRAEVLSASVLDNHGQGIEADTPPAWSEPAFLFYTSGTTGPSKGALLTQNNLLASAKEFNRTYGLRHEDIQYSAVPLFHISGAYSSVVTVLVGGHTGVLDTAFHVSTCWKRIRELNATIFFGVGAMVMMLWGLPESPDDAELPIRTLISAPIPPELWRAIERRYGCEVLSGYGQTEAIMIAAQISGQDNVPGSAGKPLDIYEVRVVDDNDDDVVTGEPGEIVVRPRTGHVIFEGYVGRPADTLRQMRNLWFHTGDLGRFDDAGNLYFVDRKKDAIRRRGENISSFEVEESVRAHPDVAECAAVAVPSELGEDEVMVVVVVAADGDPFDLNALADHCANTMPKFALPRFVKVVAELPKSATGRVQKHVLRAAGVDANTWDALSRDYATTPPASDGSPSAHPTDSTRAHSEETYA